MNSTISNSTIIDPYFCTYATCSIADYGQIGYIPSLAGNAFYLALFCAALLAQIGLGVYYRTWGFLVGMFGGAGLEIVGYTARIMLNKNDFNNNFFIIYLVGLTIGPALFSAAIYLCLARIIAIYGVGLSLFKPRTITVFFCCCDLLSLVLQAAGGAMASLSTTPSQGQTGINIMIAGLSTQVAATTAFCSICAHLIWAVHRYPNRVSQDNAPLRRKMSFRFFLGVIAIAIATTAILIRCSFRVAELSQGFHGPLANSEVTFMLLEGAMMVIVVSVLTVAHPGLVLGPMWQLGGFHLRSSKNKSSVLKSGGQLSSEENSIRGIHKEATGQPEVRSVP